MFETGGIGQTPSLLERCLVRIFIGVSIAFKVEGTDNGDRVEHEPTRLSGTEPQWDPKPLLRVKGQSLLKLRTL